MHFLLDNLNSRSWWDYWVFIPQELRTFFNTANPRHNMNIISISYLILANFWLATPHKKSEGGGKSGEWG